MIIKDGGTYLLKAFTISFSCLSHSKLYNPFIFTNEEDPYSYHPWFEHALVEAIETCLSCHTIYQ